MSWAVIQNIPALQKLVLLMLANHSNGHTGQCNPSINKLAEECGMSRDTVIRSISGMEKKGLISVIRKKIENVNLPNQYQLNIDCGVYNQLTVADRNNRNGCEQQRGVADSDRGSNFEQQRGVADSDRGSNFEQQRGVADSDSKQESETGIEPGIETGKETSTAAVRNSGPDDELFVKEKKPSRKAISIKTFLLEKKKSGEKSIPEGDPVFSYAEEIGIPFEFLSLCWKEFVDRNEESGKRYIDWRKAFRNCVRANWYKIWAVSADNHVVLTTQGKLAERKHAK
jgi:DNA-binding Lrp family transcriptional regulator